MPNISSKRVDFAVAKHSPNYPDFLDIQIKSFQDFFQLETKSDERIEEGLFNTFKENFPITDRYSLQFTISAAIALQCRAVQLIWKEPGTGSQEEPYAKCVGNFKRRECVQTDRTEVIV